MQLYSNTELENNRTVQVIAFAEKPMTAGRFNVSLYEHDGELVDDVLTALHILLAEVAPQLTAIAEGEAAFHTRGDRRGLALRFLRNQRIELKRFLQLVVHAL